VSRERERLRNARKELQAKGGELEGKLKSEADRAAKFEKEAADLRAEIDEARRDGLMYSTKHGTKAEDLIRKYVGATAPEQLAAGAVDQVESLTRKLADFEKKIADRELADSAAKEQRAVQEREQSQLSRVAGAFAALKRDE
jgi:DNA gyrase/topoisomerase IV subunit A